MLTVLLLLLLSSLNCTNTSDVCVLAVWVLSLQCISITDVWFHAYSFVVVAVEFFEVKKHIRHLRAYCVCFEFAMHKCFVPFFCNGKQQALSVLTVRVLSLQCTSTIDARLYAYSVVIFGGVFWCCCCCCCRVLWTAQAHQTLACWQSEFWVCSAQAQQTCDCMLTVCWFFNICCCWVLWTAQAHQTLSCWQCEPEFALHKNFYRLFLWQKTDTCLLRGVFSLRFQKHKLLSFCCCFLVCIFVFLFRFRLFSKQQTTDTYKLTVWAYWGVSKDRTIRNVHPT